MANLARQLLWVHHARACDKLVFQASVVLPISNLTSRKRPSGKSPHMKRDLRNIRMEAQAGIIGRVLEVRLSSEPGATAASFRRATLAHTFCHAISCQKRDGFKLRRTLKQVSTTLLSAIRNKRNVIRTHYRFAVVRSTPSLQLSPRYLTKKRCRRTVLHACEAARGGNDTHLSRRDG